MSAVQMLSIPNIGMRKYFKEGRNIRNDKQIIYKLATNFGLCYTDIRHIFALTVSNDVHLINEYVPREIEM